MELIYYWTCVKQPYFRLHFEDVFSWFFSGKKSKKSAIFLLPVYLAYWPTKCATCWATRIDHFHQVWSWYDYPSPSYSVVGADTLRDLVTLTFDLLTLDSGQTWLVTWSTPPPSLKILRLSVLDFHRPPLTMHLEPLRMCRITWPVRMGQIFPKYLKSVTTICLFTMQPPRLYDQVNWVICQNSVRPCVKGECDVCACAKSRDLSVGGRKIFGICDPDMPLH